jgi:hypothetical protein
MRLRYSLALAATLLLTGAPAFAQVPAPLVAEIEIAPGAPPPLREEVVPPPPRPLEQVVWEPGHWRWEGRRHEWVWIAGHYIERPHRYAQWEPGHWVETPHGWRWDPGHWR